MLTLLYFVVLAPFAWVAKRAARKEAAGWTTIPADRVESPTSQY
jgi:hypothetical protein